MQLKTVWVVRKNSVLVAVFDKKQKALDCIKGLSGWHTIEALWLNVYNPSTINSTPILGGKPCVQ